MIGTHCSSDCTIIKNYILSLQNNNDIESLKTIYTIMEKNHCIIRISARRLLCYKGHDNCNCIEEIIKYINK